MTKKWLMFFFLFIFAFQLISAVDTEIKLKTPQFTEVDLTIIGTSEQFDAIAVLQGTSDFYGDLTLVYAGSQSIFDLMVVLKQKGQIIHSEKFRNKYILGKPIYLEIIPGGYELLESPESVPLASANGTNSTESSGEVLIEEETTGKKSGLSGFSISNLTDSIPFKQILYIIGAIVLLGGIIFAFKQMQIRAPRPIKITKLSKMKSDDEDDFEEGSKETNKLDKLIEETESKLKELKAVHKEINGPKNEKKIKEIQERIKRDQEELKRISRR